MCAAGSLIMDEQTVSWKSIILGRKLGKMGWQVRCPSAMDDKEESKGEKETTNRQPQTIRERSCQMIEKTLHIFETRKEVHYVTCRCDHRHPDWRPVQRIFPLADCPHQPGS